MDTAATDVILERQLPLALTIPQSVTIIGCGGVGAWIAEFLALARVPRLLLWDMAAVSENNLNRLPLSRRYLGINKALALKQMLNELTDNSVDISTFFRWSPTAATAIGYGARNPADNHWLVAATDTWQSRVDAHHHATDNGLRYLEASADGEFGGITGEPATFVTDLESDPGYASVPVHVGPCVAAASLATYHILHDSALGPASYRLGFAEGRIDFQATQT